MSKFQSRFLNLVTDARFKNLINTQNFENYFNSYGVNESQNLYTVCWLLNPKGSHGLKDVFAKEFIQNIWHTVHCSNDKNCRQVKETPFYKELNSLCIQNTDYSNCLIERDLKGSVEGVDFIITDISSKTMLVVNNTYNKDACQKAYSFFSGAKYNYFTNKAFVTFDRSCVELGTTNWVYCSNDWIINLISNVIDRPQYCNELIVGQLKEFYHFLTGTPYGTTHTYFAETVASLLSDCYETISEFKTYKCETKLDRPLIDISAIDYVTTYKDKVVGVDCEMLKLYWSYRNTFNSFFKMAEYEKVTRGIYKALEKKNYVLDRQYIRNGFCYTPCFNGLGSEVTYLNQIFTIEAVCDMNNQLNVGLIINKPIWDKLTLVQKNLIRKNFDFTNEVLQDRFVVTNIFYREDWVNKDLSSDIINLCDKIWGCVQNLTIRAA